MEDERLRLHLLELLVGRVDEERLREEGVPGALADHAHRQPMRRIRAGEGVDDVDVALAQPQRHLVPQLVEAFFRDLGVDVAPPDARLGARLADDELVLRRAARVLAGVDDERPAFGEPSLPARERVLVELGGRRDASRHAHARRSRAERARPGRERSRSRNPILRGGADFACSPVTLAGAGVGAADRPRGTENPRDGAGGIAFLVVLAVAGIVATPTLPPTTRTSRRSPSATRRSCGSSSSSEECGYGSRYVPTDIDLLFDEPTVALRGPWNATDLVKIAPAATDLVDRYEYHLDFPGDALDPGCDYKRWAKRLTEGHEPVVYAHVVAEDEPARQGLAPVLVLLSLQRLQQHARGRLGDDPAALRRDGRTRGARPDPVEVGYSSHEGADAPAWDDEKLELVGGTRPVVYPAAGSHANKYSDGPLARQLSRGGRRLRRHPRAAPGALAASWRRSRATRRRR